MSPLILADRVPWAACRMGAFGMFRRCTCPSCTVMLDCLLVPAAVPVALNGNGGTMIVDRLSVGGTVRVVEGGSLGLKESVVSIRSSNGGLCCW